MIQTAKDYIAAGLSVLPTNTTSKSPVVDNWRRLQQTRLTEEECERAFYGNCNIALICGAISGNLEIIDFDNKLNAMQPMFDEFKCCIDTLGLPYEKTLSGGYHVFYRCEEPVDGNKKLAQIYDPSTERPITIIETRGEGGYVIVYPSKGYNLIDGNITSIPTITKEERDWCLSVCKSMHEVEEKEYVAPEARDYHNYGEGDRVGDAYNMSGASMAEIKSLLSGKGWVFVDNDKHVRRPGKEDRGFSATFGVMKSRTGIPLFHVFTPNGSPFEQDRSYTPFAVFSMIAFDKDYMAAALELVDRPEYAPYKYKKKELPGFVKQTIASEMDALLPQLEPEKKTEVMVDDEDFEVPRSKKKKEEIEKAEDYLDAHFEFRFDIIKHVVEWRPRGEPEWSVVNENDIFRSLQHLGIKFKKEGITALLGSSYVKDYNPFDEYFRNLPAWDGIDHFSILFGYIEMEDKIYFTKMLEKQFVRAIKCALEDEFYNRFVYVFRSREQEIGKSRLIQFFNPLDQKYFSDEALSADKDSLIAMTETFLYSLEELDDVNKLAGGISKLKASIAKRSVNVRLPYGRQKTLLYRRCTFFGSANRSEFLSDDTNTRWLIATIKSINWDLFKLVNVHDLWAQAFHLYRDTKYNWDLTADEKIRREQINLRYKQSLMEQEIIAMNFQVPADANYTMTINEIAIKMVKYSPNTARLNLDLSYLHDLLTSMGFEEGSDVVFNTYVKKFHIEEKSRMWQ